GSAATVYVREGKNFQPRTIDIGFDNNAMVYVRDGLEPGEVVSLTPPLDTGDKHATESESDQPTNETPAADAPTASGPPTDTPPTSATPAPQTNQEEAAPAGPGDDWAQMSDDERRQRMRERFEKMTPEERQAAMERMRQQDGMPGGRGGQGRPPGSQGGQPGGGSNRDEGGE
ncbi:MAG: hypothetical protein JXO22_02265, partial [Phycisphaerae bacterium]|nr:hypothetical protein [Phycisphaerae bacterium]